MPILIHDRAYVTVAERVKAIHESKTPFDITTEVIQHEPTVVVKATVRVFQGDGSHLAFTGISAANPSKAIEKQSPYEVAETSAVGRALGFAGYGLVDDIATANEMVKAGVKPTKEFVEEPQDHFDFTSTFADTPTTTANEPATLKQKEAVVKIGTQTGHAVAWSEVDTWTKAQASAYIKERGNGGFRK